MAKKEQKETKEKTPPLLPKELFLRSNKFTEAEKDIINSLDDTHFYEDSIESAIDRFKNRKVEN